METLPFVANLSAKSRRMWLGIKANEVELHRLKLDKAHALMVELEKSCPHIEDDGSPAYKLEVPPHYRLCTICGFPPH